MRNLTRNTMLPFQPYDVVTNLSRYQLNEFEMDLLKNGLDLSIPPRFLKKTDVVSQFDMIAKFMNELSQMPNSYVFKYTPSFNSLKKHKFYKN